MRVRIISVAVALLIVSVSVSDPERSDAAPGAVDEVVALVVEGTGFGHGRGLSQWGAYGWAVNHGWGWPRILDHYYGGTTLGDVAPSTAIKVRISPLDGAAFTGVVSTTGTARWNGDGTGYAALQARETSRNVYSIFSAVSVRCPGAPAGWTLRAANVTGPITFTTPGNQATLPAGNVLGLCLPSGAVQHYRGAIRAVNDSAGANRTVNEVAIDNYLRGVVPREVSTSWGDAGAGAGMHALRAQAVAARSYAMADNRYASQGGYATTCDTTSCQAYGGAAYRSGPTAPLSFPGAQVCETGNTTFECANTNTAILETAGKVRRRNGTVVATEFSASNGPRTAGGAFPAVDDPGDDVAGNPNHRWTRVIDADLVEARYGLGSLRAASTEADPSTPFDGVWDNRVRLQGSSATKLVSGWDFRNAYGLPSPGFVVRPVKRDAVSTQSMTLIGDSVGLSMTESGSSELPALTDGIFADPRFDSVPGRCTAGCTQSGVAAAGQVPIGTGLVVIELGYNDAGSGYGAKIDQVMTALRGRDVRRVLWISLTERSPTLRNEYIAANNALTAAQSRWSELVVSDWSAVSAGAGGNRGRWFANDGVHLTATGQAEMARHVRNATIPLVRQLTVGPVPAGTTLRVPAAGRVGVPVSGADAVAWTVTAVRPDRAGWAVVWPCGSARPRTANVSFVPGHQDSATVLVPMDSTGEVCVYSSASTHVVLDAMGWFSSGFETRRPRRLIDTRSNMGAAYYD